MSEARYRYRIDDIANLELRNVETVYLTYFARIGNMAKGVEWAASFYADYRAQIEELKSNPYRYPACDVYPFDCIETKYRSFRVGWFTIFYTVEEDTFTVWHVRSSKSNFTTIA